MTPGRTLVFKLCAWASPALLFGQGAAETREHRYLMGTSVGVEAYGGDASARRAAIDEAFAAMAEVDRLMSNYREDSELTRVNKLADKGPVPASDPLLSVLVAAQEVSARSGGVFDITVGPLVRLWGFHDKKAHLPTPEELERVRPLVGYGNLVIDRTQRTVLFARPGVELDLGGIAKGFAVELAAGVLKKHALAGFIDAGGNQYLQGLPPGKGSWTVGINNPDLPGELLGVLKLGEGSVSTSAQDANFLKAGGRKYGHILDPRTLRPSEAALSATVVSRDGTLADALSKVAFILGPEEGRRVLQSFPGTECLIAYHKPDGSIGLAVSPGLAPLFRPAPR